MASVQPNNVSGPVTLRQQCPGLTTTHDPWRGCAMANADPTPFEEKISTISKLLKLVVK